MPSFIATGNTGGGGRVEHGLHKFEVVEAEEKMSRAGNEMIEVTLENEAGGRIKDKLTFTEKAFWKIESFLASAGNKPVKGQNVSLTTRECLEMSVFALVGPQKDDPQYNQVDRYLTREEAEKYKSKAAKQKPMASDYDSDEIPF